MRTLFWLGISEGELMTQLSVAAAIFEVLRAYGATTVFGNPGSNELAFLRQLPEDFRYVFALHEGSAVAMADGYAQATGRPAVVSLHAAAGTGNGMGMLTNASTARSKLLILAGQQVRATVGAEPFLTIPSPTTLTAPLTGFSGEPLTPQDAPRMVKEALADMCGGTGKPAFVALPYDDLDEMIDDGVVRPLTAQPWVGRRLGAADLMGLASTIRVSRRPALVVGSDCDGSVDPAHLESLAIGINADVYAAPSLYRLGFPNQHPRFRGVLPASQAGAAVRLAEYDLVVVLGAPLLRYHQYVPATDISVRVPVIHVTDDVAAAARAPGGQAVVAGLADIVADLLDALGLDLVAERFETKPQTERCRSRGGLMPADVFAEVQAAIGPDAAYVVESTSTISDFFEVMDLRRPHSYFSPAAGGLGYGVSGAVGVQLAMSDRRVVAFVGDGSMNYTIPGLWTAAQMNLPILYIVLRNGTYQALREFSELLKTGDAPYLSIPGIDFTQIARGYGVASLHADDLESLRKAVLTQRVGPLLVQVDTIAHPMRG